MLSHRLILVLTEILFLCALQLSIARGDSCYSCRYQFGDKSPTNDPGCADPTKNSSYLQKCVIGDAVCSFSMQWYKKPNEKPHPDLPYTIERECLQRWPVGTPPEKRTTGAGLTVETECIDDERRMPTYGFACHCKTDKCNSLVVPYPGT